MAGNIKLDESVATANKDELKNILTSIRDSVKNISDDFNDALDEGTWKGPRRDSVTYYNLLTFYGYSSVNLVDSIDEKITEYDRFLQEVITSTFEADDTAANAIEATTATVEAVVKDSTGKSNSGSSKSSSGSTSGEDSSTSTSVTTNETATSTETTTTSTNSSIKLNGNTFDVSEPIGKGKTYNLSENEIRRIAYLAMLEQGSLDGVKMEVSLMANLAESKGKSDISAYIFSNNSWFGPVRRGEVPETVTSSMVSEEYVEATRKILCEGYRYIPSNVVEHDWLGDITSVTNNGVAIDKYDKSAYISGVTVIHNNSGATYVFDGFAPNGGDPFGHYK